MSVALTFSVAMAGPSLLEPPLPGRAGQPPWSQPPWSLAAHPSPYLVVALAAAAIATGTVSVALTLAASRRGWRVPPGRLLAAGLLAVAALTLVPPFGSSDHLSYAAYGRLAATGHDPYTMTPAALARLGDPVARAAADGRASLSVYGPLATGGQALASLLGGTSARLTVFVLGLLNAAAFTGTGLLLHRLAHGDRRRQQRAALLWTANPLLLAVLVAGAHVDSQAIVFAVAALAVFGRARRQDTAARQAAGAAAAGALAGAGAAVKVTMVLAALGLALAVLVEARRLKAGFRPRARQRAGSLARGGPGDRAGDQAGGRAARRDQRPQALLGGLAGGFAVAGGASLAVWGPGALDPALRAGSQVSIGSPWRAVRSALRAAVGEVAAEDAVKAAAIALSVVLLLVLLRAMAAGRAPGPAGSGGVLAGSDPAGTDPVDFAPAGTLAAGVLAAVVLAWLFAWPYVLPWYDGLGWAALAARPGSRLDGLLLARTAALALGYLPGRGCYPGAAACQAGVPVPPGLGWLETVVRSGITPAVLLAATVGLVVTAWPGRERRGLRAVTGTAPPWAGAAGRPPG